MKELPLPWILAQTETTSAPATAAVRVLAPFNPSTHELLTWGMVTGAVIVCGLALLMIFHKPLKQQRLRLALLVTLLPVGLYIGALWLEHADPVFYWLTRALTAALIFSGLQLLDRALVVPLLTRGGAISIPRFIHQIISILLAIFAIVIFGSWAFGWDIDRFLAGSAVVSIVLGLALQETLGNFFSGLVMQASPPFAIGHRIKLLTYEGDVVDMTWRAVTILTDDDDYIIIPNATVAKSEILNYSVPTRSTARYVRVGLEYDLPPADAITVLKAAAQETEEVLKEPAPIIYLEQFADSAVVYAIKFWITNAKEHDVIQHHLRVHVWYRLKERGYNIPYPVRTVEHSSHQQKNRSVQNAARGRRIEAINGVPLLSPLTDIQKRELADSTNDIYLAGGQILFRQGDAGSSFYVIYKGEVEVLVTPEGKNEQRVVATLKAGDFFGEMSALTGQPRSATIRAKTPLACVQVEKQDLLAIFEKDPHIMEKISEIVARRNLEREAVLAGAGAAPTVEVIVHQQKSLLGRMMNFFGLAKAA